MINRDSHPVVWALLMYELEDAREHLASLIGQMSEAGLCEDEDYRIQLGHVYAHLNRAWNTRDLETDWTDDRREMLTQFPTDLEPSG